MYRVWSQRRPPAQLASLFDGLAEIVVGEEHDVPLSALPGCHAAIVGAEHFTAEVFDSAPELLLISRTGVGYDRVDVPAATARKVAVAYTPDAPTISTAEHAVMLLFLAAKKTKLAEHKLRNTRGRDLYKEHDGAELHSKTLGLIGYGRIGRHVATIAAAAGMNILAYDPYLPADSGVRMAKDLDELFALSDFITLHVPATPETTKIINADAIAKMKDGAFLINASRGALVDEEALLAGLDSGKLAGAALDVTDPEPPELDNPLLWRDDVIVTPHIGSATVEGKLRIFSNAVDNVVRALSGDRPQWMVNPDVWPDVAARMKG